MLFLSATKKLYNHLVIILKDRPSPKGFHYKLARSFQVLSLADSLQKGRNIIDTDTNTNKR